MSKFEGSTTKSLHQITEEIKRKDVNVIYVIECTKCPSRPQYVGKSTRCLQKRGWKHINAVDKGLFEGSTSSKMYQHFTAPNHSSRDMLIFGIEAVHVQQQQENASGSHSWTQFAEVLTPTKPEYMLIAIKKFRNLIFCMRAVSNQTALLL